LVISEHDYDQIYATQDLIKDGEALKGDDNQMLNAGAIMDASFDHGDDNESQRMQT